MIDADFIIRYTNALYSTPVEFAPRYDEFRDMFSSGQLKSKLWIINELTRYSSAFEHSNALIVGAWFGTLGIMLKKTFPKLTVSMLDIDPRCEKFINNIIYDIPGMHCYTQDMYNYNYTENLIINTSCEHISDLSSWINLLPAGKLVALQSNNYFSGSGHINCVSSKEEFASQSNLKTVCYAGELKMPMYTRFTVIGIT